MKKVNVQDAIGMELCHDITEMNDGFKGVAFKRGHIIRQEAAGNLQQKGLFRFRQTVNHAHKLLSDR